MIKLCAFADEADKNFLGQIKALHRNKIKLIEIRNIDSKNIKDITQQEAKNYQKLLVDNGISVFSLGSPLGKVDINTNFNQYKFEIEHLLTLSNIFQTTKIRVFSFYNAYSEEDKVFEYLNYMVEEAKSFGVDMCHENEKDIFGDTLERVIKLVDNVPNLKFVYDPANFVQVGEDTSKAIEALYESTEYFHIKDVIASTGELVPAGYGDGNVQKIIDMIGSSDKVLTIEPHLALFDGYSNIDNTKMKNKFIYKSTDQSFDAAVNALKSMLLKSNYVEVADGFTKQQ